MKEICADHILLLFICCMMKLLVSNNLHEYVQNQLFALIYGGRIPSC